MSGELIGGPASELPIGTEEEVRRAGMDPTKVRCCAPEVRNGPVLACKAGGACRFDRPKYGGFKFVSGPQNLGVEIITGDVLSDGQPVVQQMIFPCYNWVTKLQKRADFGQQQRADGKPGEIISIVAFEGEEIESRIQMPINVAGEVIKQSKDMFDLLAGQGIRVNREDRREAHDYVMVNVKQAVPHFPRPGERKATSYAQRMIEKANERIKSERDIEDAVVKARRQPSEEEMDAAVKRDAPETYFKRGPGRPKKEEVETNG